MASINPEYLEEHWGLGREFLDSITGHFIEVPNQTIIIDEFAAFKYTIRGLVGTTSAGSVSVVIAINGVAVTGLNGVTFDATQDGYVATGSDRVEPGDLVTMTLAPTSAADFSWALEYRRRSV